MKIKLEVPFYSQHEIVTNGEGHLSCGVVCVKMIIEFFNREKIDIYNLLKEGIIVGGKESAGWKHESLVRLFRNHNINSYPQEFISHDVQDLESSKGILNLERTKIFEDFGIEKIKNHINNGFPVMISVKPNFGNNPENHLIVVVGYDNEENFYINDPQRSSGEEHPFMVSIEKIKEFWKGLAIFVEQ